MKLKRRILFVVFLFLFLAVPVSNVANATTYEQVFKLTEYPGGSVTRSLTVSVTSSLYYYYASQNHNFASFSDFAKFITPYAVKPIADALSSIYSDDEVFADGVLSLVQQIPYLDSPEVYPVETLKLNYGDCGSLSLLTASILKAGGLDVVLLEYPSQENLHLNVGVNLSHSPTLARSNPHYVNYEDKHYYVAESTGDNFPNGWRVGELPINLTSTNPNVISIDGYEQTSPGQVSASYKSLNPSQILISVSSSFLMENNVVTIGGTVSPSSVDKVNIYVSSFTGAWQVLTTVNVDSSGHYAYQWTPLIGGIYYLQASWSGNKNYAGADSQAVTLYVIPLYGLMAAGLGVVLMVLLMAFWLMSRRSSMPPVAPGEAEAPSEPPSQKEQQPQQAPETTQSEPSQPHEETTPTSEPQTNVQETSTPTETTPSSQGETQQPPSEATTTEQKLETTEENTQSETSQPTSQPSAEQQPQTQATQPEQQSAPSPTQSPEPAPPPSTEQSPSQEQTQNP